MSREDEIRERVEKATTGGTAMTMTNEEIDALVNDVALGFYGGADQRYFSTHSLAKLATALKSAIQDSKRIEWMEFRLTEMTICQRGENKMIYQLGNPMNTTLREAIDARVKGEGA